MRIATDPPYSPDRTPSDFNLFDHVKILLRRRPFETREDLFSAILVILASLEKLLLRRVFLECMTRLE
jgi:hypothetical protein